MLNFSVLNNHMAKFRSNHSKGGTKQRGLNMSRSILLLFIGVAIIFFLFYLIKKDYFTFEQKDLYYNSYEIPEYHESTDERYFLPHGGRGQRIDHVYYSLSYLEKFELAEWVAYELTKQSLLLPNVERSNWFEKDEDIRTQSADYYDYKGSGYSRGHLAPAADMAFSKEAMKESFLMSNMSPQLRGFNNGIWKELEENVRDWAFKNIRLYVVTGPVISKGLLGRIGKNKVAVPKYFYKVILDINDPEHKAIAFIIPNETSEERLESYAMSVDEAEKITGLDFFASLINDKKEEEIESSYDISKWPLSDKRYKLRLNKWNKQ